MTTNSTGDIALENWDHPENDIPANDIALILCGKVSELNPKTGGSSTFEYEAATIDGRPIGDWKVTVERVR